MSKQTDFVHCMLIPLHQHYLLLPNSLIAEVLPITSVTPPQAHSKAWLSYIDWQDRALPIVDLEQLISSELDISGAANKLCILNSLNSETVTEYFAIPCSGSPQLITLNSAALKLTHDQSPSPYLHCQIQIGNKVALLPNLDAIELAIENRDQ